MPTATYPSPESRPQAIYVGLSPAGVNYVAHDGKPETARRLRRALDRQHARKRTLARREARASKLALRADEGMR